MDFMFRTAKSKAELQDLVRTFDAHNVRLQRVRDRLCIQLTLARLDNGKTRTAGAEKAPS
ncbi:hypothetical protein ACH9DO_05125 [Kocuria sp. M1N1S27]|uniref:hypothetical protein n=1 Tax=Kocuria kalidii TaxID=3376283 RepID=UPI0037BDF2D4